MPWKLPRPRFGLRALLLLVLACGIGLAFWTSPGRWRTYRNQQARQRIDPYELSIAGDGNSHNVPPELLAILGDSRLKHWGYVGPLRILSGNRLASHGRDEKLRIWDIETGRQKLAIDALSFTVSGDRKVLFFATADGTIKRTAVNSLQIVGSLPAITGFERFNLAASKDGTILVSEASKADMTREITTWDVAQSRAMNTFRPPSQAAERWPSARTASCLPGRTADNFTSPKRPPARCYKPAGRSEMNHRQVVGTLLAT